MATRQNITLLLLVVLVFCLPGNGVYAFGAGNIPSYGLLKGKAFRHGDIEEVLGDLFKRHGVKVGMFGSLVGKYKFSPMDIKRIYFGNWLRDFSQAMDIATLNKAPWQSIITIVVVLGFMSHGYATEEFEVTRERLGVYLPVEHIDNPKGYGEGKDPREVDPGLRPVCIPEETEIDPKTGMKNYIANDSGSWDTSRAYVRRTLEKCIESGRRYRSSDKPQREDKYEAFRLLGAALHTLEDFPAHSNFCELCLVSMGHTEVFTHVGDDVKIKAPDGRMVAPVVTGVFGSDDFMHSLFSEGTDRISSVTDLNHHVLAARRRRKEEGKSTIAAALQKMLSKAPGDTAATVSGHLDEIEKIGEDNEASAQGEEGKTKPENMTPQELYRRLWKILSLRDKIVKTIDRTIERVPGLRPLLNMINDQISGDTIHFSQKSITDTVQPILGPVMRLATTTLQGASHEVLSNHDQCEVFDNPHASDPTHSFLSKDHFTNILNHPAGNVAKIIVSHTVSLVVHAWDDKDLDVTKTIDEITECLFHPDFHDGNSMVQSTMLGYMHEWVEDFGHKKKSVLKRLTKESVRENKNILRKGETGPAQA
ncbi:heterokaryon incompatibility Het-C, partial [Thelephora terrestris]